MGLNHIYKVIWSKTKNAWVVVSEIAKRDGKSSVKSVVARRITSGIAISLFSAFLASPLTVMANPSYVVGPFNQFTGTGAINNSNTVVGDSNRYNGEYNTLIGTVNIDSTPENSGQAGFKNTLIGYGNSTKSKFSTLLGNDNTIKGLAYESIAIGTNNSINDGTNQSIVIGSNASVSGIRGIAIGWRTNAQSADSLAIGNDAVAEYERAVAYGGAAQARAKYSLAIGFSAITGSSSESAVAVGYGARSDGKRSISILGAAAGENDVVIGFGSSSKGASQSNNVILGTGNQIYTAKNVVIGNNISIGPTDKVNGGIILGDGSRVRQYTAPTDTTINGINIQTSKYNLGLNPSNTQEVARGIMAIGNRQIKDVAAGVISATSTDAINGSQLYEAVRAVTVGANPDMYMHVNDGTAIQGTSNSGTNLGKANEKGGATGTNSIAIGIRANSTDESTVAIGQNAAASDKNAVAIGKYAQASDSSTVAIGDSVSAGSDNSIAIGKSSSANGVGALTIGTSNSANGYYSVVLGNSSYAYGESAIAIGKGAGATGNRAIAIGENSKAIREKSIAIGIGNEVNAEKSSAIGDPSYIAVAATGTHVQGNDNGTAMNPIQASESTFMGNTNLAHTPSTTGIHVVGNNNSVDSSNVMVMGNNVSVGIGLDGAVVLGNDSSTNSYSTPNNTTISGLTLDASKFYGTTTNGSTLTNGSIVSIGSANKERQIKNVAAGVISATSTDAVNGSQLYEAVRAVTAGASPDVYMHVNDGTSTQGAGNATTNLGKANEKGGATGNSSIAIGMHASAKKDVGVALGTGSVANDEGSVAIGSFYSKNVLGVVSYNGANATGKNAISILGTTSGDNAIAIGYNARPARDAIAMGFNTDANEMSIAIGANRNVAGTGSVAIGATTAGNNTTVEADDSLALLGGIQKKSTWGNNVKNSNAIGRGTFITSDNTTMIGSYDDNRFNQFSTDRTRYIAPRSENIGMMTTYGEGTLENSVYLGHDSFAFTVNSDTDGENSSSGENSIHTKKYDATGNIVVSNNTTGGAFGKVSKAAINGDEITGFAGAQSVGAVTIGAGDYERRIQNVAAGEVSATSTDGINGSQLYAVADTLSKNMSSYMHINDGTSTQTVGNATTNYGYSGSKAGATGNLAIAGGMNAKASGQQSLSLGSYTKSEGDYSVVIGSSHDTSWSGSRGQTFALGNYSVVLGRGAQTWKDNSIAIGHRTEVKGEDSIGIGKYVFTGGYSPVSTEMGSGITAVGTKLGVDGINTNVFGQGDINNIGGGSPILANDSTILGNRNGIVSIDSNDQQINPSSINDYATGSHILGNDSSAWGNNAIVIGNKSIAYRNSVALGYNAVALKNKSIAVGYGASARGEESISIGTGNNVEGAKSSAIGDPSYIDTTATGTHVQGNDNGTATNPIKASESTFMGNTNLAGTAGTTGIHVVGNNNTVDSSNVMVMGNNVTVGTGLDGAVVLGHASSADQYAAATDSTINGVTFDAAGYAGNTGLNNGSIVSVGATGAERQIKNVAAGAITATSTDAVNGSQLYKTAETILKMPINMAGDSGDTVGLKLGKTVNIKGSVASGADVTDGNIAVVGDKATSTLSLKMAKNLTGLTSGTFTDASGNQTVINGAGVTVTPTGTGATPISITTSGINAGNQEIKGVKKGTTDDAAVNKKQMDDALAGISSTLTINDGTTDGSVNIKTGKLKVVGESGANALVTTTVSGDTISVGTSTKLQNAVTAAEKSADKDLSNLSTTGSDKVKTLAQDAVKVAGTGLATVSDATAAGVKTYTVNVDEGKLVIDDTTGKIGAAGASQGTVQGKDGVATTQNVASVVNSAIDKTKQALDDAKHNFAGDDATVISRKHGEQLNIKGGASTTASDLTSGNIAVVGDTTSGTLNIKMAKALTGLTSATYTDAAGNTQTVTGGSSTISDAAGNSTVVSKGGVTTTDGTNTTTVAPTGVTATDGTNTVKLTGSGIDAGNTQIKNVGKATTDDAAVNKKQMDDALKGATDNTVSLGSESGSTTAKKLSTTGGIKFNIKGETGANALITTSATGDDVTIAPTAKLSAAVTAAEKSADKDLSNLSAAGDTYIKNLAKTAASWNVETNGGGTTAVAGGESVNFINGDNIAITNAGRAITIGTAKNVSFDKVTVGGVVLDKTDGINAGGKEVKGIADGTAADSAVSKGQMETAIANAQTAATSTEKVIAKSLTGDTNLATVTGQTGTAKGETYEVAVSENAVKNVAKAAAQDAVTVTGTGLATVSDNTTGGVKTYTVNVDEGKLVLDDTTGKIGANGATQGTTAGKNGVATTQNVATAINDAVTKAKASTTQALADAEHKFDGDTGTTSVRKHGEVLSIKGGVTTPADLATGNIGVVSDGAGTLNIRLAKVLSGLTSATFTTAGGNTTVINGDGVTITPSGAGASAISMTTDGINAGGKEVKGIADGTAADSAVSKGQMETAIANAQTAATSTEKVIAKALTGDTNLATVTGQTGTAKGETYEVAVSENAVKNVAKVAAQDAVTITGTGLATVSDNTVGGVKTYTVNVDEGKLVLDDTTGKIGANGATQGTTAGKNGVATTQNVATAINDAVAKAKASTTQALADAEHKFDGDTGATSVRKHGEVLSIKGGVTTPADLSTGNIGVVSDGAGTLNIRLAKVLSGLTSATFTDGSGNTQTVTGASSTITDGAGNTTAMTKGGLSTTDGTNTMTVAPAGVTATDGTNTVKLNGSGIDAGNTQIKNVGKATTDDAAVNKKQMDDAVKAATDATTALGNNTIALGSDAGSTTAKKLSTSAITFNIKGDTGANALITTSATGDDVTIAPTAKLTAAVTAAEKSADKDLSNISSAGKTVIKDLAATSAQDAVNVTGTGLATVSDNIAGGVKTYTVNVDEGKLVLDDTTGKIGANGATQGTTAGKNGVATTQNVATAINDAITKANANTAQALADAEHKFDGDTGATSVRKHGEVLSIKGGVTNAADLATGNIGVVSDGAGTLNIRLAKILSGLTSATFKDASGNTTMVTGGSTTIADTSGNTQTLAPTKSEIKDNNGVSTVTTKDGVTAKDASGQTTSLTKGGVNANDGNGNTTSLTNTGVSATDGNGHTTGLTNGGLSTTDGTNTTTVAPTGITATDGTNTVKLNGSGIDAGNTQIKNVGKATTDDAAVNKKQMDDAITKATADATHEFGGDDATVVSRKHGEKLTIKGGASTNAADLTSGNIAVIGDTNGTLNLKLAKVLTGLTSATFTDGNGNTQTVTGGSSTISDAAGNSTVVSKGGVTTTDAAGNSTTTAPTGVTVTPAGGTPISITTDGINAGGKEVKGIANGTTNDAAVNKGQMDAAVQNALDGTQALGNNTITLGGDTGSTDAKKLNTSGGIQFNIKGESGANALIRTTASGNTVSIASTDKLNNAVAAAENAANKDLSNLSANGESRIKDLAKSAASWNVQTNGGATTAVSGGDTVNFVDGKNITITNTGREITVATTDDVSFNKVTVGGVTLDNNGIDAGNKEIKNVAAGTTANSAVNKQQLDNAISGVSNINYTTSSTTDRAGSTPVHSVALSTGFDFKGDGNIQISEDAANNGVIHYAMNPNLSGITSITGAGTGAPTMTFNSQNGNTPANVSINSNLDMGGHRITGVGPAEKPTDAVNKQQVDQALRGLTGMADNAARQYASKAGANAAALAALKPIQYDPLEPTQIMAGVGNYKSQTAVALGMAHYTNENTMFNIGVSLDSHDNMVNAGVTHKFGYSPEKKAIPDRYKGGPISSIYVMQDEMQALLAKDQEKDAVISKQASEIDTLRQQNEDMQRKIDMILAKLQ